MFRLLLTALVCLFLTDPSYAQTTNKKTPTKAAPKPKAPKAEAPKAETPKTEPPVVVATDGKININTATVTELDTLNGVGEATAKKIIEYRETKGAFKTVDDLAKAGIGIGEKTLEKFRDQITVGDGKTIATAESSTASTPTVSTGPLININTASAKELDKLNGVGEVTAQKIIAYREANGPFKTIDDLKKVAGVGDKTFDKFRAQITVDGSATPITTTSKETPVVGVVPTTVATGPKININTASAKELDTLNGVGEVTAQKIIAYREANGPFKSVDDLAKAGIGIGAKTLEKFRDQITVGENTGGAAPTVTPAEGPAVPVTKTTATVSVNINTADLKELGKLPGVGDTTAQRILDYRTANGPFKTCKDLGKVKGIGDKSLEKIEPSCNVK
jgi:competence protein ComEA